MILGLGNDLIDIRRIEPVRKNEMQRSGCDHSHRILQWSAKTVIAWAHPAKKGSWKLGTINPIDLDRPCRRERAASFG